MSVYTEYGYKNRKEYLNSVAEDYGCPVETVYALAGILGESEDFDGLICTLEDYVDWYGEVCDDYSFEEEVDSDA